MAIIEVNPPIACVDEIWEAAYRRFESPETERRKFRTRYQKLGAQGWDRNNLVAEIFCGRGNGLKALAEMGFTNLVGLDLSRDLLDQYDGPAQLYVCDCRRLPFEDVAIDMVVVQGGLHHLPTLPDDLAACLSEVARVLKPNGRFVLVEPWRTPFLDFVHAVCRLRWARRLSAKLDALATMIEREQTTYFNWLARPKEITTLLHQHFVPEREFFAWGKANFVGQPRRDLS